MECVVVTMPRSKYVNRHLALRSLAGLALLLASVLSALASDTIYLKNGRKITADSTREEAKQVFFTREGGEFAIAKDLIDHIEKSAAAEAQKTAQNGAQTSPKRDLPVPAPAPPPSGAHSPAIKNGAVDESYLQQLDDAVEAKPTAENRGRLAQAYVEAANFLAGQGQPEAAIEKYQHALRLSDQPALAVGLGYLLLRENRPWESAEVLLPAADKYPKVAEIPALLGSAYYAMEDLDQAIQEWARALALQERPDLREALAKAQREREAAGSYQELRSEHFLLRYDEGEVKTLADQMQGTLESDFLDLERDLDVYPQQAIVVLLYPKQAFRDVTRSPDWAGAVNDGKIRVPVSGLSSMTPELARVLKHELTHSFVHLMTLDHCPAWFNEGLAQLEEGSATASELARAFVAGQARPYSELERPFLNLETQQAKLAYEQSLAAVEYLRDTYGMPEIRQLLRSLATGLDMSALLLQELRLTYPALDKAVADSVRQRYGSS